MQSRSRIIRVFWRLLLIWLLWGCERLSLPVVGSGLTVKVEAEAVLVTEVWLRLQVAPVPEDGEWQLWRGDSLVWQAVVIDSDTVAYDSGLLPNHSYTYQARLLQDGKALARSKILNLTTMDTTSHDFEWEVIEFPSPYGSGALYDVAIIDENNIWAVGEIYADSARPWLPYNAVHWDGSKWELVRIPYIYEGQPWYHPMSFVFAFHSRIIWFGGNGIVRWDGQQFTNVEVAREAWGPVNINKIWGSSENNVFIVGNSGYIAHYDGVNWRRVESGTEERGNDVWGMVYPDGRDIIYFAFS
ncbi:MAG: glucosyl transferase, partial [Calditrichaeota bacterium]|nr:glucosyl transferase [Calditrichota bacterium]